MRLKTFGTVVGAGACAMALASGAALGDPKQGLPTDYLVTPEVDGVPFCTIPVHHHKRSSWTNKRALTVLNEIESNDTIATANTFVLTEVDNAVNIHGTNTANENDYFKVDLEKGDILGLAVLRDGGSFDPMITVYNPDQTVLMRNDDGVAGIFPLASPLPGGVVGQDSDACIVIPETGTYFMRVHPWVSGAGTFSEGDYILQARWFRSVYESRPLGDKQFIWVDFTGPTINAAALFGGNPSANLSPLSSFLPNWGLGPGDMNAVVNAIITNMEQKFDALAVENPHFDYTLRNSHQHVLLPGTPDITRIIIGGTIAELGVSTLGIAESIDPGNFDTTETGVVLLDLYSAPAPNVNSINSLVIDPSSSIIEAIGQVIGHTAAHEAGHTFGGWHTNNSNGTRNTMDSGGTTIQTRAGVGPDGIFGTADDLGPSFFVPDFYASEGVGVTPFSVENTDVRMAYAMSSSVCGADLNDDNAVDGADLGLLLGNWGNPGTTDFNGDGTTNGVDLGLLLGNWGDC
ncbi:MAG: hypothetical protein ACF8GE_10655 [Phycisphaerales bacterium JB043]